ncbi:MAG: M23 family metallopeptidase [Calditrichaeota bacterium]|nr:M23 family metallopeptidase [Calditrichota bacterium]
MKDESRLIFVSRDHRTVKEVKISRWKIFTYLTVFLVVFLIIGKIGLDMIIDWSLNSEMKRLARTNLVLQNRLVEMSKKIKILNEQIEKIASTDDQLRTVLGLPKLNEDIRKVGIGGSDYNYEFLDQVSGFEAKVDLSEQLKKINQIEREVKLEIESYQSLLNTFYKKQDSVKYLPALRPVLKGVISSGFGLRYHPIYKVMRHHEGVDISAPRGTPVYASADGVVRFAGINGGYGKMIMLDHNYGFETRYGHLNKIVVRRGQRIKRGEKIGEVGNTGLSTAPHLHYEVLYKGRNLDPALYFFNDQILNRKIVSLAN